MMDMREFQEKLEQLMELAAKQEKNLNNEQILEIFGLNQLSPQQLQSLYEYLRIQGIRWEMEHSGRNGRIAAQFVKWYLGNV